jgi:acyl-coenzyme A thioesterase PaaI-like protein
MTTSSPVARPSTYVPWPHLSPLLTAIGELWWDPAEPLLAGFTVDETMLNGRRFLHAGAICTIADVLIGHGLGAVGAADRRDGPIVLRATFLGIVPAGAWVDVAVSITRAGRRLSAGSARFTSDERLVATADALFMPVTEP